MSTKETDGRPSESDASGEANRRTVDRVNAKSSPTGKCGKSAGVNSDAGRVSVNTDDINSMLRQQELLAAKIARSRTRAVLDDRIQKLMDQRANPEESEDPRGNDGRKRRRIQPDVGKEKRRVRQPVPPPSSGSEPSEWESAGSEQPQPHRRVPRSASDHKQRKNSRDDLGYTSRSAASRARLAELELAMQAEKAKLAQHQRRQPRAADDRHDRRLPHGHRGREDRRGTSADYPSESDGDEHVERRGRHRARPEQGRVEARGRKRARSSSDESDIDSHAFESDVSQDREGESSSSDEGEAPPSSARLLNARDMLSHWRREAKVLDATTQRECRRILRLLKVFKHENPVHKPRHLPMLVAFRAELVTLVVTRTHGPLVAAGYNIQRKALRSAGGVDQRALDKAVKRHKSNEAAKNESGLGGPRPGLSGRPPRGGGRGEKNPRGQRRLRPEPTPSGGGGGGKKLPQSLADMICHKCKKTGHRVSDCPGTK